MAIIVARVEASPFMLKYLLSSSSGDASNASPTTACNATIANALGATPDLATDAAVGASRMQPTVSPLQKIVNARRSGYSNIAAGATATQTQARALLLSDDDAQATITNRTIMSCEMFIQGRGTAPTTQARVPNFTQAGVNARPPHWVVDASIDASTNPIVIIKLDQLNLTGRRLTAYLTIRARHSLDY